MCHSPPLSHPLLAVPSSPVSRLLSPELFRATFRFRLTLSPAASTQCFVPSMSASWSDPLHIQHTWTYVRAGIQMYECIRKCVCVFVFCGFVFYVVQVRTCCQMDSNTLIRFLPYPVIVCNEQNKGVTPHQEFIQFHNMQMSIHLARN